MATDPICGMYVDERTAELKLVRDNRAFFFCSSHCLHEFAAPEAELARLRRKLAVSWPLSIAVVLVTYVVQFPEWPWVALVLASVVQFYPGFQFYVSARDALVGRNWNMDVLIALGTTTAFGYSVAALALPGRLPPALYFDASSLIVTLILTGNYLEHLTRERARGALREIQRILPSLASVLRGGAWTVVPVSELRVGDVFRTKPGERLATDGIVEEGRSSVDESLLTGESMPVVKAPGNPVIAGAVNGEGALTVRATRVGEDTFLAQIGQLVTEAETSRVPLQALADRIASSFVPVVLLLGAIASAAWYLHGAGFTIAVLVLVSVLITACPCAFGIATPAAIVVGTGRAAEEGILFKGKDSLERASLVDIVVTDKTGTLTRGRPALTDATAVEGTTDAVLVGLAASVEAGSEHPLSRAVVEAARARNLLVERAENVASIPGSGVRGQVAGKAVEVLNGSGARERGVDLAPLQPRLLALSAEAKTWSVVLRDGTLLGVLGFRDPVAPGAKEAVRALARDGVSVIMATGDNEGAARAAAEEAGIREVHSGLTPAAKLELIRRFQREGHSVAFVGDGVNDAPALAAADLGIAIGSGTDVAREASGVVLIRSDFRGVGLALRIGRRTVRKVRGNLSWAIGYNSVLLPVAMGVLVPFFGLGIFQVLPVTGALAMGLSSTSVVLNSLTLRWVALD